MVAVERPSPLAPAALRASFRWGCLEAALAATASAVIFVGVAATDIAAVGSATASLHLPVIVAALGVPGAAATHLAWQNARAPAAPAWGGVRAVLVAALVGMAYVPAIVLVWSLGDWEWVIELFGLSGPALVVAATGLHAARRRESPSRPAAVLSAVAAAAFLFLAAWAAAAPAGPFHTLSNMGAALGVHQPGDQYGCPDGPECQSQSGCGLPGAHCMGTTIEAHSWAPPLTPVVLMAGAVAAMLAAAFVVSGREQPRALP